jgi:hypothetical protein
MIPIDWSDLQGSEQQLQEILVQASTFELWMESMSQGRVQVEWRHQRSWVRMPGSSEAWYTERAFPANRKFAEAAIAEADPVFDFTNVDAVVFFLPTPQLVFLEGSQGTVDSGLDSPIRTTDGTIPSFAVIGSYFEQPNKNHWSAWVHYSLIWMGMAELFDAKSNRDGAPRTIPIGNMSGFDIMSSQDGAYRQLNGWSRFLLDWMSANQIFCKDLQNLSTTQLSLVPIGQESDKPKLALIKISETKIIAIESRRLDKRFDCARVSDSESNGVIVYLVDTTQGHVTGETISLVQPGDRMLRKTDCNLPPLLDPVLKGGEYVEFLGLRVKVVQSGDFDSIEVSRL